MVISAAGTGDIDSAGFSAVDNDRLAQAANRLETVTNSRSNINLYRIMIRRQFERVIYIKIALLSPLF